MFFQWLSTAWCHPIFWFRVPTNEHLFKILCNILESLGSIFCWWGSIFWCRIFTLPPLSYKIVNSECGIQNLAGKYWQPPPRFSFAIWKEGSNKTLSDSSNVHVISCRPKNCTVSKKWELISFIKLINFDN